MTQLLWAIGLLVSAVAAAAPTTAPANGAIRGRVDVRVERTLRDTRPDPGGLGMAPMREMNDRRRSVVYLETAPRAAFESNEQVRGRMDQRNEQFVPHVLAITAGTWVDFPNDDRTYHNVFSLSKPKRFDLGRYATGRSKSVRFDRPGVVRVFCEIHSHMNAFILVFTHRFFGVTDPDGRYQIDGVPPGTYTLVAWVEGTVRDSRSITVTPDSRVVEADFPLR